MGIAQFSLSIHYLYCVSVALLPQILEQSMGAIRPGNLRRLAGRDDNSVPTRFLAPVDCSKIPAQKVVISGSVKTSFWQKSYESLKREICKLF
jgi:hypothetical protein